MPRSFTAAPLQPVVHRSECSQIGLRARPCRRGRGDLEGAIEQDRRDRMLTAGCCGARSSFAFMTRRSTRRSDCRSPCMSLAGLTQKLRYPSSEFRGRSPPRTPSQPPLLYPEWADWEGAAGRSAVPETEFRMRALSRSWRASSALAASVRGSSDHGCAVILIAARCARPRSSLGSPRTSSARNPPSALGKIRGLRTPALRGGDTSSESHAE